MEKSLTYKKRITLSDEAKAQKDVERAVRKAELQLKADISATEDALDDANTVVENLMSAVPFDALKVVEAEMEVQGLERGLKRLQELQEELFPKE